MKAQRLESLAAVRNEVEIMKTIARTNPERLSEAKDTIETPNFMFIVMDLSPGVLSTCIGLGKNFIILILFSLCSFISLFMCSIIF